MRETIVEVRQSPELGRYATVTRSVRAGELLFEERPFVVGPKPQTSAVCLGCCCPVDGGPDGPRCPACRWPLCAPTCVSLDLHRRECEVFVSNAVRFHALPGDATNAICMQLDCITPLRFLLEIEANPDRWDDEIRPMECHTDARLSRDTWLADEVNIVGYLHGPCALRERFSGEMVQQVCGILEVNSFEGRSVAGHPVRCIFPQTAVMAHACVPNTMHTIYPSQDFRIQVRATVDVAKDELLYASYTYTMSRTSIRQEHLKLGKFFTCQCARCADPTELGTHFSSLQCQQCVGGLVMASDPIDQSSAWSCNKCTFQSDAADIQQTTARIQLEFDSLHDSLSSTSDAVEHCEKLIGKYTHILHPNHSLLTVMRQTLIEMYGRVPGYTYAEMPACLLERKIELCHQVLNMLNVLHPGITRSRALLLYEMQRPLVQLAHARYRAGTIDLTQMRQQLAGAQRQLEFAESVLRREDVSSVESVVGRLATKALAQLRQDLEDVK